MRRGSRVYRHDLRYCDTEQAPNKLMLPRDFGGCGDLQLLGKLYCRVHCNFCCCSPYAHVNFSLEGRVFRFNMLGLGDIAVPGLFLAFLAKWDAAPWPC